MQLIGDNAPALIQHMSINHSRADMGDGAALYVMSNPGS